MKTIYFLFLSLLIFSCAEESIKEVPLKEKPTSQNIEENEIIVQTMDFDHLNKEFLSREDEDKIMIINFWATWCGPCVRELPQFEEVNKLYDPNEVEVVLVSLDMKDMKDSHLIPYIKENNILSKVIHMDDPNMNRWIPLVDENWGGSIPATIIYQGDRREFIEGSFENGGLLETLNKFKN